MMKRNIIISKGNTVPVCGHDNQTLPRPPLKLNNVLFTPSLIKSLMLVRRPITSNQISIQFDSFGFLVKDL